MFLAKNIADVLKSLSQETWDAAVSGKTVFVKFLAPWRLALSAADRSDPKGKAWIEKSHLKGPDSDSCTLPFQKNHGSGVHYLILL